MAETAGTLRAAVQRLVRDVNATYHTNAFVLDMLSRVQRLINVGSQTILASATLTTAANQLIYTINSDVAADAIDIMRVTSNNEDIAKLTLNELNQIDRQWFRKVGSRFEAWAQLGRTLLVVYPAQSVADSVTVTYSKLTTDLSADGTNLEFSEEANLMVMDLTEAILLLRQRDIPQSTAALKRFIEKFSIASEGTDLRNIEIK
jgi:hypothetical protein